MSARRGRIADFPRRRATSREERNGYSGKSNEARMIARNMTAICRRAAGKNSGAFSGGRVLRFPIPSLSGFATRARISPRTRGSGVATRTGQAGGVGQGGQPY